jgi:sigma-B regulation protein RsbU (phosphoserine phosphatase)
MTTDGIEEAMNPAGEDFGKARLKEALGRAAAGTAADVVQAVREAVTRFMGDAPQRDDLTMVVLKAL